MSKKSSPKKNEKEKGGKADFPTCINKKEARMVCLNDQCDQYPFFCSTCDDSQCQIVHQHNDKLVSVGFKEFSKRVLRQRKPVEKLGEAITSYRQVLEKLKADVSEFIEKQLASLEEIQAKVAQIPQEDSQIISKLKQQNYEGLTGAQLDQVWTNSAQNEEKNNSQEQLGDFIKIKEEEVRGISEHFQHLNQMEIDNLDDDEEEEQGAKPNKKKENKKNSNSKNTPAKAKK